MIKKLPVFVSILKKIEVLFESNKSFYFSSKHFIIILSFLSNASVFGFDTTSITTCTISNELEIDQTFTDLPIYIDCEENFNPEHLINGNIPFKPIDTFDPKLLDCYIWTAITVDNKSTAEVTPYFFLSTQAVDAWMYSYEHGEFNRYFVGVSQNPSKKILPTAHNLIPFSIKANQKRTYYFKTKYFPNVSMGHYTVVQIVEQAKFRNGLITKYTSQSFYVGLLVLLSIVSFLMYFSFKDKSFIFFSLLMLSFAFYFLRYYGLLNLIYYFPYQFGDFSPQSAAVSAIELSLTFFMSAYLGLKDRLPKYYRVFFAFTFLVAAFPHIMRFGNLSPGVFANVDNAVTLVWIVLVMIPVFILAKRGYRSAKTMLISILILFVFAVLFILRLLKIVPDNFFTKFGIQFGLLIFSGILFYGMFNKISKIRNERIRIAAEKQKSEELLFNILPKEIANELKEKGKADARNFDLVSVLFTDFKGFTKISENLTPNELVQEINVCFEAFDHILEKYAIEKIKTIGDAYMAAGGLSVSSNHAVKSTLLAALEMQEFIAKRKAEKEANGEIAFDMRLGIHTGPVVAGIVGIKKFQYDIWGDTVNTASRMESSGAVGEVNISQATYELIKDDAQFTFESRGKIEAKGKGGMEMYFVQRTS